MPLGVAVCTVSLYQPPQLVEAVVGISTYLSKIMTNLHCIFVPYLSHSNATIRHLDSNSEVPEALINNNRKIYPRVASHSPVATRCSRKVDRQMLAIRRIGKIALFNAFWRASFQITNIFVLSASLKSLFSKWYREYHSLPTLKNIF